MMFELSLKVGEKTNQTLKNLIDKLIKSVYEHADEKEKVFLENQIEKNKTSIKNYVRLCIRNAYKTGIKVSKYDLFEINIDGDDSEIIKSKKGPTNDNMDQEEA